MLRFGFPTKTETNRKIRQRAAITAAARGIERKGFSRFEESLARMNRKMGRKM
jgi:hypothetical protein